MHQKLGDFMKHRQWIRLFKMFQYMVFDIIAVILPYLITIFMFKIVDIEISVTRVLLALPFVLVLKLIVFYLFGFYHILLRHIGFEDFIRITIAIVLTNALILAYIAISQDLFMYKSAYIFITIAEIAFVLSPRIINRIILYFKLNYFWGVAGTKTMIIGAGAAGELVVKEIYKNRTLNRIPVIFLDDSVQKIGNRLLGIPIVGPIALAKEFIKRYQIDEVILAIHNYPKERLQHLIEDVASMKVKMRRLHMFEDLKQKDQFQIIDIRIEDLLNREEVILDDQKIFEFIHDETVLVTGGGGSIGSELCRQIAKLKPKALIIFDIYENNAYDIQMELERTFQKKKLPLNLTVVIGSVYNEARVEALCKAYRPTIVFHAAAYKHVPLMEHNAVEAIRTNVLGTYYTSKYAKQYQVKKFVLVSSDKAVRATNIMGATKRYAELIIQDQQKDAVETVFAAVRFGNVLGSNGSVIPLFKKQIEDGGPVTITHEKITRYFMTIPEAVGLILECGVYARGSEVFVLDMGEPVLIKDLAEKMIRLSGLEPYLDIDIQTIGLRPGEKLYEELLVNHGSEQIKTENKKILIETQRAVTTDELKLDWLTHSFESLSNEDLKRFVSSVIKSYQMNGDKT